MQLLNFEVSQAVKASLRNILAALQESENNLEDFLIVVIRTIFGVMARPADKFPEAILVCTTREIHLRKLA